MTHQQRFRLSELPTGAPTAFRIEPDADERAALASGLGVSAVRKLRFEGILQPVGRRDWQLDATLGATVVQPCVVTLAPVTTRIEEQVVRRYLATMPETPEGAEIEMPEDDTADPLPETLNVGLVMAEALALALPRYPRAEGAKLADATYTEPGKKPMTDEDAKPFADLAEFRDRLSKKG